MQVHTSSWHWRVFLRWERRKRRTAMRYDRPVPLDLCRYMRVVFIFAPWRWFWQGNDGRFYHYHPAAAPWAITAILLAIGGFVLAQVLIPTEFWITVGIGTGFLASIAAVIVGLIWLFSPEMHRGKTPPGIQAYRATRESLPGAWLRAKKQRICPILEVPDDRAR